MLSRCRPCGEPIPTELASPARAASRGRAPLHFQARSSSALATGIAQGLSKHRHDRSLADRDVDYVRATPQRDGITLRPTEDRCVQLSSVAGIITPEAECIVFRDICR